MKILGIETVTRIGSLSVVENGNILVEETVDTSLNHAAMLIPVLDRILKKIGLDIGGIDAISVDIGPGSFTGMRVGIATGCGLAENKKRLCGITSLEILCYEIIKKGIDKEIEVLVPFIDAKRGGVYAGWYIVTNGGLNIVREPYLTDKEKLRMEMPKASLLFGPDVEDTAIFPTAKTSALLGEKKILSGQEKPVEPMYIYEVEYRK